MLLPSKVVRGRNLEFAQHHVNKLWIGIEILVMRGFLMMFLSTLMMYAMHFWRVVEQNCLFILKYPFKKYRSKRVGKQFYRVQLKGVCYFHRGLLCGHSDHHAMPQDYLFHMVELTICPELTATF